MGSGVESRVGDPLGGNTSMGPQPRDDFEAVIPRGCLRLHVAQPEQTLKLLRDFTEHVL